MLIVTVNSCLEFGDSAVNLVWLLILIKVTIIIETLFLFCLFLVNLLLSPVLLFSTFLFCFLCWFCPHVLVN